MGRWIGGTATALLILTSIPLSVSYDESPPPPPHDVVGVQLLTGDVVLAWLPPDSGDVSGYNVYAAYGNGPAVLIGQTSVPAFHGSAGPGAVGFFVTSQGGSGESAASNVAPGNPYSPCEPIHVYAYQNSDGSVTHHVHVHWECV